MFHGENSFSGEAYRDPIKWAHGGDARAVTVGELRWQFRRPSHGSGRTGRAATRVDSDDGDRHADAARGCNLGLRHR